MATMSLVATLFPARVEAVAPDLPTVLAEPSAWGLPTLPEHGGSVPLLDLDRAGESCTIGDDDICVVRSTIPTFSAGEVEPDDEDGWEYVLWDLGAEQARGDASGPTWDDEWSPAPGSMVDGGSYVVTVAPAGFDFAELGEDDEDPSEAVLVAVDRRGDSLQEWQHAGPFAIAPTTGELVFEAPLSASPASVPLTLTHRSSAVTTHAVGPFRAPVGGGWEIGLPVPAAWYHLTEYGATGTVELVAPSGQRLRFVETEDGSYELPRLLGGAADAVGVRAVLDATDDGGWKLVDTDGAVYVFDYWGDLIEYTAAASDDVGAATYQMTWQTGQLTSVTDPITGRRVELRYVGGVSPCSSPPDGFDPAPLGALCEIVFVDDPELDAGDQSVLIGWSGDRVAAFLFEEGRRLDVATDAAGALTALRDPLAAMVAAIGAGDEANSDINADINADINYDVTYDEAGRVDSVTGPASTPGAGDRETLSFAYADGRTTATHSTPGAAAAGTTIEYDPETWATAATTDALGLTTTALFDHDDDLVGYREGGQQTVFQRSDDGRTTTVWGPAPVSMFDPTSHLPLASARDDMPMRIESVDSTEDARGWVAAWWDTADRSDSMVTTTLVTGPITSAPPAIGDGWSAELVTTVERDDDVAGYLVGVDGATLELVTADGVNLDEQGLPIDPDADGDDRGPVLITVLLGGEQPPSEAAPVTLTVTTVDADGQPLATIDEFVAPLQLPTERTTRDWATGAPQTVHEVLSYDDPLSQRATALTTTYPDGTVRRSTTTFEGFDTDFSELWRPTAESTPSGMTGTYEHWDAAERATPPGYETAQLQGGLLRTQSLPPVGGVDGTETTWWTSHGEVAATLHGATGTTTTYLYDVMGRNTSTTTSAGITPGAGASGAPTTLTTEYGVTENGLFVTTETSTTEATGTTTMITYRDRRDRVHHVVDPHGVRVDSTYSATSIDEATYLPTGLLAQTTSTTLSADGIRPVHIATQAIDGRTHWVDVDYDAAMPWVVASIADSAGITTTFGFDGYGLVDRIDVVDDAGTRWSEQATLTPDGRIVARTQSADGVQQAHHTYAYGADGTASAYTITTDGGTTKILQTYDPLPAELAGPHPTAPSDRTPSQIVTNHPDGRVETITIGYDDQAAPHTVTRDGERLDVRSEAGALVRYDLTDLVYDQFLDVTAIDDGEQRYEYLRSATGDILTTVSTVDGTTTTYHHTIGGLALRPDLQPAAATLPSIGVVTHTVSPEGSAAISILGLDGDVRAHLDPEAPALGTATATWFGPYGTPLSEHSDGAEHVVTDHAYGWQNLPGTMTANHVVITPFRAMIPEIASFTTPDPIEAGSTLYNYTDGDPYNDSDRTGLAPTTNFGGLLGSFSGLTSIVLMITTFFFPKKFIALALLDLAFAGMMWGLMYASGDMTNDDISFAIIISIISLIPLIPSGIRALRFTSRTPIIRNGLPSSSTMSRSVPPPPYEHSLSRSHSRAYGASHRSVTRTPPPSEYSTTVQSQSFSSTPSPPQMPPGQRPVVYNVSNAQVGIQRGVAGSVMAPQQATAIVGSSGTALNLNVIKAKSAVATTGMSAFAAGTRQGALMQQVNPSLISSGLI